MTDQTKYHTTLASYFAGRPLYLDDPIHKKSNAHFTHQQAWNFANDDPVNAVSITPDGKRAISGSWDKTCILWNLETGEQIARFITNSRINSAALFPKGVVLGSDSGEVMILNAEKELLST